MEYTTIKGFRDILPLEIPYWQLAEAKAREVFKAFGFKEIRTPILEKTELFVRSIGSETDIVSKEMYTFKDSKGRGLTLRPEATASVVRAYIQNRLYQEGGAQKLFSIGPMFRHERPQKGRFRQFHQINAEMFGDSGPKSDAELIVLALSILGAIGLQDLTLNINSIGCPECRPAFREELSKFLEDKSSQLCADCQRRSKTNPLRVFDCKVDSCKAVVSGAPVISQYLCQECESHFQGLKGYLRELNVSFMVNAQLVRGLDYYTRTTFEIQTERLGAQNAVVGGGRYDGLVKQLGGPSSPAIGFAVGVERVIALLQETCQIPLVGPDLFIAALGERAEKQAFSWAHKWRKMGLWIEFEYASKGLKAQMKRADKLGAKRVLIVGDNELDSGKVVLRDMSTKEQVEIEIAGLEDKLREYLS